MHEGCLIKQRVGASWYGPGFHGRRAANGEIYNQYELTAAHRTLPFGTLVEVTRRDTGHRVVVRINDRGPFVRGRILDLSRGAARRLKTMTDVNDKKNLVNKMPALSQVEDWIVQAKKLPRAIKY